MHDTLPSHIEKYVVSRKICIKYFPHRHTALTDPVPGWVKMPFFLPLTLSIFSPFIVTYWSDIMGGGEVVVVIGVSAVARLPHPYAWPPPLSQHVPKLPLSRLTTDRPQPPNPSDIGSRGWIEWQSIVNTGHVVEGGGGSMPAERWTSEEGD